MKSVFFLFILFTILFICDPFFLNNHFKAIHTYIYIYIKYRTHLGKIYFTQTFILILFSTMYILEKKILFLLGIYIEKKVFTYK